MTVTMTDRKTRYKICPIDSQLTMSSEIKYSFIECECEVAGSDNLICDKKGGKCYCKVGFNGQKCGECDEKFFGYPNCKGKCLVKISKLNTKIVSVIYS